MNAPPSFASMQDHLSRLEDVDFWRPYVVEILRRHGLADDQELVCGYNPTHPTFLCGDAVVKLFGYLKSWRECHAAESAAHALLATDPGIAAPALLGGGQLCETSAVPWHYLIIARVPGIAWEDAELSGEQRFSLAAQLGRQVRRVHALRPSRVATETDWPPGDIAAAARRSSLPPHLVSQIDAYLPTVEASDHVFIHGDVTAAHAFMRDGQLTGVIDWGDAMVTDRHCELIQIYRDTFDCDKSLFGAFLEAADWPVGPDFPRQTLAAALRRQAIGLAQHPTIDVFEPIAEKFPLLDIGTLGELAIELFDVYHAAETPDDRSTDREEHRGRDPGHH